MSCVTGVRVIGLSASTGKEAMSNRELDIISPEDSLRLIKTTGIETRHTVSESQTAVDLCEVAAAKLLDETGVPKDEIGVLFLVTQTPDYLLMPASAPILQMRLGLSMRCAALDITLGCSGFTYGLQMAASFMTANQIKYGLVLAGDTLTKAVSRQDKSVFPLFGDGAGVALLEFTGSKEDKIWADVGTDGRGYEAILIPDGGYRSPFSPASLEPVVIEDGIRRNRVHMTLDGIEIFNFGMREVPKTVQNLLQESTWTSEQVDIFAFHQANLMMNELIRKKLKLPPEKVPYSLKDYGNTSCASIPMTLVTQRRHELESSEQTLIACGFGVGLSWATLGFKTNKICCPELILI